MVKHTITNHLWFVLVSCVEFAVRNAGTKQQKKTPSQAIYGEGYFSEYSYVGSIYSSQKFADIGKKCSNTLVRYKCRY